MWRCGASELIKKELLAEEGLLVEGDTVEEDADEDFDKSEAKDDHDNGTLVLLSPNGQWLRMPRWGLFVPISSICSMRKMPANRWGGRNIYSKGMYIIEIVLKQHAPRDSGVAGPERLTPYLFGSAVTKPMTQEHALEFLEKITSFTFGGQPAQSPNPSAPQQHGKKQQP